MIFEVDNVLIFYPSKNHDRLNGRPFHPERVSGRACVNPKHRIKYVLPGTLALCDSGAFQDIDDCVRLSPRQALERQLMLEAQILFNSNSLKLPPNLRIGWDWHFEAVVIYDQMAGVDEEIVDGKKVKRRGTIETAASAVAETLRSAEYYHTQRARIAGALCFVGQGVTPDQYINDCLIPMSAMMRAGDWFAYGGFCILGKVPSLLPVFYETFTRSLPILKDAGIKRLHLLGVNVPEAVTFAVKAIKLGGWFELSNDNSGPEVAGAAFGKGYTADGRQAVTYERERKATLDVVRALEVQHGRRLSDDEVEAMGYYIPCRLAMQNIEGYTRWASGL